MTIATTTVRLGHRVRLRNTASGELISPVTARSGPLPYGWSMRVRGGDVVVSVRDGSPAPAVAPVVTVAVADLRLAALVQTPSVDVALVAPDITVDVALVPMKLVVELATAGTGAPRTGRTVTARATTGPTPRPSVPLPETAPGIYASDPVVWTPPFLPLDLLVNGDVLRQLTVDITRSSTHLRLVDNT